MTKADSKHMVVDESKWKFLRIRLPVYVDNCTQGYLPVPKRKKEHTMNEVHHLLNVHSCSDENIPKNLDKVFLTNCFVLTIWDINGEANVIGLPKKWAYLLDDKNKSWHNLPCHQIDHDHYWTKVDAWVREEIFQKLHAKQAKKQCDKVKGEDISKMFNNGSKYWLRFLKKRGIGAKAGLDYCTSGVKDKLRDKVWYIPLSMSPTKPRPRAKPAAHKALKREGLLDILDAIV